MILKTKFVIRIFDILWSCIVAQFKNSVIVFANVEIRSRIFIFAPETTLVYFDYAQVFSAKLAFESLIN